MKSEPPPLTLQLLHHLPGLLRVFLGVGADQHDGFVAKMAGRPYRPELRMREVGAAARMRLDAGIDNAGELAVLGVHHRYLVAGVGGDQEVALAGIQATVVQEARRPDLGGLEVVDVLVVDQQDLAGLLDVDHELRTEVEPSIEATRGSG